MPHGEHNSSEELLIQDAIAGDKQAFGRLYEIYADQIVRYLYFRVGEHSEAVDMTEVVFLKAWEKLPGFGSKGKSRNFRAWLYRIAHNAMVDYHRTKKNETALDEIPEQPDHIPSPGQLVEKYEQSKALMQALESLDELSRQVVTLRFLSGVKSKDIAEIVGISTGNVRVIQFRAVRKLRELMGDDDE